MVCVSRSKHGKHAGIGWVSRKIIMLMQTGVGFFIRVWGDRQDLRVFCYCVACFSMLPRKCCRCMVSSSEVRTCTNACRQVAFDLRLN